jgi:small subunit ribosomal protein S7
MARKFTASKEQLRPDPRFGSKLASKFINCLMYDGKKSPRRCFTTRWT